MTLFVPELLAWRERQIESTFLLSLFLTLAFTSPGLHAAARSPACLTRIQGFMSPTPRPYHWGQWGVQAGLGLAVVGIAVLVAAAVVDEADLEVHPALQPAGKYSRREGKSGGSRLRSQPCWMDTAERGWGCF